jgi:hypothetical protein
MSASTAEKTPRAIVEPGIVRPDIVDNPGILTDRNRVVPFGLHGVRNGAKTP